MSSKGCSCGLMMNVLWKLVLGSRTCIREGPLTELGMCPWHDVDRSGRWSKTATSSCCHHNLYSTTWMVIATNMLADLAELANVEEADCCNLYNMLLHRQFGIEQNAKITHDTGGIDHCTHVDSQ